MVLELVRGTWKGYGQNAQQKHHTKRKAQRIFCDIYQWTSIKYGFYFTDVGFKSQEISEL